MSRAWVLNLDAELELELAPRYTPSDATKTRVRQIAAEVEKGLEPGDVVVELDAPAALAPGLRPRAWCPTPRALAALARAGLALEGAPSLAILRAVNERGFAFVLAEGELEATLRAIEFEAIEAHVAERGPTGEWLLKRGLGVAGRGQRPVRAGRISDADRAWIRASLRRGALYLEPRVPITRELSVHGWTTSARIEVRSIREQRVRERAWVGSDLARGLAPSVENALIDTAERVGRALIERGYRGPFGVDAFLWTGASGAEVPRTLSEINARFCMGWDRRDGWDPPNSVE